MSTVWMALNKGARVRVKSEALVTDVNDATLAPPTDTCLVTEVDYAGDGTAIWVEVWTLFDSYWVRGLSSIDVVDD